MSAEECTICGTTSGRHDATVHRSFNNHFIDERYPCTCDRGIIGAECRRHPTGAVEVRIPHGDTGPKRSGREVMHLFNPKTGAIDRIEFEYVDGAEYRARMREALGLDKEHRK